MKLTSITVSPVLSCRDNALILSVDNSPLFALFPNDHHCQIRKVGDGYLVVKASPINERTKIPATVSISVRTAYSGIAVDFSSMFDLYLSYQPLSTCQITCFSPYAETLDSKTVLKCYEEEGQSLFCLFNERQDHDPITHQIHIRPGRSSFFATSNDTSLCEANRLFGCSKAPNRYRSFQKVSYDKLIEWTSTGTPLPLSALTSSWYYCAKCGNDRLADHLWHELSARFLSGEMLCHYQNTYHPAGDYLILLLYDYHHQFGRLPQEADKVMSAILRNEKRLVKGGMMPFSGNETILNAEGVPSDVRFFGSADNTALFLAAAQAGISLFALPRAQRQSTESLSAWIRKRFADNFMPNGVMRNACALRASLIKHPHSVWGYCDRCRQTGLLLRKSRAYLCEICQDAAEEEPGKTGMITDAAPSWLTEKPALVPFLNTKYRLALPLREKPASNQSMHRFAEDALFRYWSLTKSGQRQSAAAWADEAPLWLRLLLSAMVTPHHSPIKTNHPGICTSFQKH